MDALELGELIRRARRKLGITQLELAMSIDAGARFIVELEAGKPTAQLGKALAAAKAVGIRLVDQRSLAMESDLPDLDEP